MGIFGDRQSSSSYSDDEVFGGVFIRIRFYGDDGSGRCSSDLCFGRVSVSSYNIDDWSLRSEGGVLQIFSGVGWLVGWLVWWYGCSCSGLGMGM